MFEFSLEEYVTVDVSAPDIAHNLVGPESLVEIIVAAYEQRPHEGWSTAMFGELARQHVRYDADASGTTPNATELAEVIAFCIAPDLLRSLSMALSAMAEKGANQ